ncbi:MAG: hypothetical protein LBB89_11615 [Treponema sp.]|jgi:hypothetical protein|nr:hypothetical protein [Treponema sp.]
MKNHIKFFGIVAIMAVIGLSMVSCGEKENTDPKRITITGITGVSSPSVIVALSVGNTMVNYNLPAAGRATVSGTVSVQLKENGKPTTGISFGSSSPDWTGTGEYYIVLFPIDSNNNISFTPIAVTKTKVNISQATTTVAWSQFQ